MRFCCEGASKNGMFSPLLTSLKNQKKMGFFKKIGKALGKVGKGVLRTVGGAAKSVVGGATGGLSDKLIHAANNAASKSFGNKGINPLDNRSNSPLETGGDFMSRVKLFFQTNWQKVAMGGGVLAAVYFLRDKIFGSRRPTY